MADSSKKVPRWTSKFERPAHNFEKINGNSQAFHITQIAMNLLQYFDIKPSFTRSGKRRDHHGKRNGSPKPNIWNFGTLDTNCPRRFAYRYELRPFGLHLALQSKSILPRA